MYHGNDVPAKFFKASSEPSHVFYLSEESLDNVAHGVESGVMCDRLSRVAPGRKDRERAFICNALPDRRTAISLVRDYGQRRLIPIEKGVHDLAVVNMSAREFDAWRAAFGVCGRMNFTCTTAACAPSHIAIIDRRSRTIARRQIPPWRARAQDIKVAVQHPPIVFALGTALLFG